MEYKILKTADTSELEVLVQQALKDGWKLQGGVSVADSGGVGKVFVQAIMK